MGREKGDESESFVITSQGDSWKEFTEILRSNPDHS
jgi:hypothetical protein